jgi:hypothetical protein
MDYALMFLLGLLSGSAMFMGYGVYQFASLKKKRDSLMSQIKTKVKESDEKSTSIKDRLLKAAELAQAQVALKAQIEMPSKNALHSKYKNDLVHEIQDMEQRKLDLLTTILAEGFDPTITVVNETGKKEEIPLSSYVGQASRILSEYMGNQPPPLPNDPNQPRKAGKFIVYKGGKDDGTTH